MDTLKVIGDPTQGYLGVYHTGDDVKLATSSDLLTWTFRRTLDPQATQPSIRALPTGGFLTATEYNNQVDSGGRLRVRHYPDLSALFTGAFSHDVTIQRTLSGCNEGTPTISVVALEPDIERSVIDLDFHYQRRCDVDRQANGRLTNFTSWTATADPDLDRAITAAAAAAGNPRQGQHRGPGHRRLRRRAVQRARGAVPQERLRELADLLAGLATRQHRLPADYHPSRQYGLRESQRHDRDRAVGPDGGRRRPVPAVRGRGRRRGWATAVLPGVFDWRAEPGRPGRRGSQQ
jgi:hypothetical protein